MNICKKCGEKFEPKKGLVNYCSLICRNSRTWSDDDKKKKSISAKNSEKVMDNVKHLHEQIKENWEEIKIKREKNRIETLLSIDYGLLSEGRLRERVILEQDKKCGRCGLSEWFDVEMKFELDHIDGNNKNNDRNNLIILCPNCHSLTPTWRGGNKRKRVNRVSDEKLLEQLILNNFNMRKSLLFVGMSAKGGNYKRCHKLKREYESLGL